MRISQRITEPHCTIKIGKSRQDLTHFKIHVSDDGLRRGTDDEFLFEFFAAAVRDDRELRRESFHVFFFFFKE